MNDYFPDVKGLPEPEPEDTVEDAGMSVDNMLGNAATASQRIELLEDPVVRGALVRSFAQWMRLHHTYDPFYHGQMVDDLENSEEAQQ